MRYTITLTSWQRCLCGAHSVWAHPLDSQALSFKTLVFKSNWQDLFLALLFLRIFWAV